MTLPADPRARFALGALALIVGLGLALALVNRLLPSPHGPQSSSYATSPSGLAAYATLLERSGHKVRQLRTPVAKRAPLPGETLVVLDPDSIDPAEARAMGRWVRAGGRLLAGGSGEAQWLRQVITAPPLWEDRAPARRSVLAPAAESAGVRVATGAGGWRRLGGALPVLGPPNAPLVVVARSGRGTLALIADATPLQNRGLGQEDNAALGLALAGPGRPVAFLETVHGYGAARGLRALPRSVKWALIGLLAAGLMALWAVGRRLGPPEDAERPLPPPRIAYVDALAAALVRAKPEKPSEKEEARS